MRVKDEFIDSKIFHPASGQVLFVRWIDPVEYQYFYEKGYQHLFEDEEIKQKPKRSRRVKKEKSTDVIPNE